MPGGRDQLSFSHQVQAGYATQATYSIEGVTGEGLSAKGWLQGLFGNGSIRRARFLRLRIRCHSHESGKPRVSRTLGWIPTFAGVTILPYLPTGVPQAHQGTEVARSFIYNPF